MWVQMLASGRRVSVCRTAFSRWGAAVLAVLLVTVLVAGCGSSGKSGAASTGAGTTSTPTQTGTSTSPTPTTGSEGDVSGKLDKFPRTEPRRGELPAVPSSTSPKAERDYLKAAFEDAQHFWKAEFQRAGVQYHPARLVLFSNKVNSGCGEQADTGPFYCPANLTVYLDVSFFDALAQHVGVGPFGQAYIVGHELGHHVQRVIGVSHQVAALNERDPGGTKPRSVRVELQADCLSGVWAHSSQARGKLTEADFRDALATAAFVGDDFQQRASGRVVDSALWTHGSSAQRQHWLLTGAQSGTPDACDTFANQTP